MGPKNNPRLWSEGRVILEVSSIPAVSCFMGLQIAR